jgi:hypothetical protein
MGYIYFKKRISSSIKLISELNNWVEKFTSETFDIIADFSEVLNEIGEAIQSATISCYDKDNNLVTGTVIVAPDQINPTFIKLKISGGSVNEAPYLIILDINSTTGSSFKLKFTLKIKSAVIDDGLDSPFLELDATFDDLDSTF